LFGSSEVFQRHISGARHSSGLPGPPKSVYLGSCTYAVLPAIVRQRQLFGSVFAVCQPCHVFVDRIDTPRRPSTLLCFVASSPSSRCVYGSTYSYRDRASSITPKDIRTRLWTFRSILSSVFSSRKAVTLRCSSSHTSGSERTTWGVEGGFAKPLGRGFSTWECGIGIISAFEYQHKDVEKESSMQVREGDTVERTGDDGRRR
jgi:hypothetical protein